MSCVYLYKIVENCCINEYNQKICSDSPQACSCGMDSQYLYKTSDDVFCDFEWFCPDGKDEHPLLCGGMYFQYTN